MVNFSEMKSVNRIATQSPVSKFTDASANIAVDLVELAELQSELLKADIRQAGESAKVTVMLLMISLAMGIASLPVIAFGIASVMSTQFNIPTWAAQLGVGCILLVSSLITLLLVSNSMHSLLSHFRPSSSELRKNFEWLKQIVRTTMKDN